MNERIRVLVVDVRIEQSKRCLIRRGRVHFELGDELPLEQTCRDFVAADEKDPPLSQFGRSLCDDRRVRCPICGNLFARQKSPRERAMDDNDFQELADKLRRGREKIEKALSETMAGRTDELVRKINELRERIESHGDRRGGSK